MKPLLPTLTVGAVLLSLTSLEVAAEADPQPVPDASTGPGAMIGMSPEQQQQLLRKRQEQMLKMHDLMHQIRDAKDEQEKERLKAEQIRLMEEHWRDMQSHRQSMRQERMQKRMEKLPPAAPPGAVEEPKSP